MGLLEIWGHLCRRDREGGTSSPSCDGLSHSLSLKSFILVIPEVPDLVILRTHDSSIPRHEMPVFLQLCDLVIHRTSHPATLKFSDSYALLNQPLQFLPTPGPWLLLGIEERLFVSVFSIQTGVAGGPLPSSEVAETGIVQVGKIPESVGIMRSV